MSAPVLAPVVGRIGPDGWDRYPTRPDRTVETTASNIQPGDLVTLTVLAFADGTEPETVTGRVTAVTEHDAWWKAAGPCDLRIYLTGEEPVDIESSAAVWIHR